MKITQIKDLAPGESGVIVTEDRTKTRRNIASLKSKGYIPFEFDLFSVVIVETKTASSRKGLLIQRGIDESINCV